MEPQTHCEGAPSVHHRLAGEGSHLLHQDASPVTGAAEGFEAVFTVVHQGWEVLFPSRDGQ